MYEVNNVSSYVKNLLFGRDLRLLIFLPDAREELGILDDLLPLLSEPSVNNDILDLNPSTLFLNPSTLF